MSLAASFANLKNLTKIKNDEDYANYMDFLDKFENAVYHEHDAITKDIYDYFNTLKLDIYYNSGKYFDKNESKGEELQEKTLKITRKLEYSSLETSLMTITNTTGSTSQVKKGRIENGKYVPPSRRGGKSRRRRRHSKKSRRR